MIIVFEGADGVGKSSVINELKKNSYIIDNDFVFCKEPADDDEYLKKLRNIILTKENYKSSDFFLLMASRFRHFKKYVVPYIDEKNFIFDRYFYSSLVYQVEEDFANFFKIIIMTASDMSEQKKDIANRILFPDLIFYFFCDLNIQIKRQKEQKNEIFRFEKKSKTEKAKIKNKYQQLFEKIKLTNQFSSIEKRLNIVDVDTTNRSINEIKNFCLEKIKEVIDSEANKIQKYR